MKLVVLMLLVLEWTAIMVECLLHLLLSRARTLTRLRLPRTLLILSRVLLRELRLFLLWLSLMSALILLTCREVEPRCPSRDLVVDRWSATPRVPLGLLYRFGVVVRALRLPTLVPSWPTLSVPVTDLHPVWVLLTVRAKLNLVTAAHSIAGLPRPSGKLCFRR